MYAEAVVAFVVENMFKAIHLLDSWGASWIVDSDLQGKIQRF